MKKYTYHAVGILIALLFGTAPAPAYAEDANAVTGTISDVEGRPVEGARVFVYDSSDVKRSANYISPFTGPDGTYRLVVSPGKYWVIARFSKHEGYGPLMPGDKHSGEPVELEVAAGQDVRQDFVVADLQDARRLKAKGHAGPAKITGRILDGAGAPVSQAYAFASRTESVSRIPEFVSAWTDAEGRYTLYLPRGNYFLGCATSFPPDGKITLQGAIDIAGDKTGVDIVLNSAVRK